MCPKYFSCTVGPLSNFSMLLVIYFLCFWIIKLFCLHVIPLTISRTFALFCSGNAQYKQNGRALPYVRLMLYTVIKFALTYWAVAYQKSDQLGLPLWWLWLCSLYYVSSVLYVQFDRIWQKLFAGSESDMHEPSLTNADQTWEIPFN